MILSIDTNPLIRCYRIHAYVMNILMLADYNFEKYVLSNYLCLHNGKDGIRREYLDFHLDNNYRNISDVFRDNEWFDIVQIHDFDSENYRNKKEIKDSIIYFLNQGYYLLHNVNEYCLPHASAYGQYIDNNIAMTYGYDEKKDNFLLLDYNRNGHFGSSAVPSKDYFRAIFAVTVTNRLNFIKAKKNLSWKFDNKKALNLLSCHIKSENAYSDHDDFKNNIFGYEGVERTLKELQSSEMNMIRIRVIKEHKDVVLKYMQYIVENGFTDNAEYYEAYKVICSNMNKIFMRILKRIICNDGRDFTCEIDAIRKLNESESELLQKYLSYSI